MAAADEKRSGDEMASRIPPGFRFVPTEEELVRYYLLPRLQGRPSVPNDAIIDADIYQCHPDRLINEMYMDRGEDSWYFLTPRSRKYGNGGRPSRTTNDGRGRWKISTAKPVAKNVVSIGDGSIKFRESVLGYWEGPIVGEKKTKWLMREFTIPQFEHKLPKDGSGTSSNSRTLDDYVMCRIYVTPRNKEEEEEEEEAGPSGTCPSPLPGPAESGGGTAAGPDHSERLAGKRPVEEELVWPDTALPKRACTPALRLGQQPAQSHAGAMQMQMQARSGPNGYRGGCGTGRPMMVHSYNESMPPQQPPPAPFHGSLVTPYRVPPAPSSFGQTTAVMRPRNPAGEAVRPPSAPRYPEMRGQGVGQQRIVRTWVRAPTPELTGHAAYTMQQQWTTAFTQQQQQQQQQNEGGVGGGCSSDGPRRDSPPH